MSISFLKREGHPDIAYQYEDFPGHDLPAVVFLTGFRSDMEGTKAAHIAAYCKNRGQACIRFDYRGHGKSGGLFEDGTIGLWLSDALAVIDRLTSGKIILVGSSMGGWIALLCALARKSRVRGLIGLAAAPDFTREIRGRLSHRQADDLEKYGHFTLGNEYSDHPYMITRALIEEGDQHCLLDGPIDLSIPVRLIQGMKDDDVPWQKAQRIIETITGHDKKLHLVEQGDHRLSRPEDLACLCRFIDELSVAQDR